MINISSDQRKLKRHLGMKTKRTIGHIVTYIVLIVLSIIWLYPILWIVLNAFRTEYTESGTLVGIVVSHYFPTQLGFDNFVNLFTSSEFQFGKWFLNTLIVAVCTCIISTFLNLCTAYVMSKLRFRGRKAFMNFAMVVGLFPGFMSIMAIYFILKAMGLTQSLFALILCYSAGAGLGFYVAKGYFDTVPNALVESARLDGAINFQIFVKIVLPLSKPILIYTALMAFTGPWMDFIFARVILGERNYDLHTVAVGLYMMMLGQKSDSNNFTTFAAGCICVAVPIVALFIAMQKYYIEGATAGAVKG